MLTKLHSKAANKWENWKQKESQDNNMQSWGFKLIIVQVILHKISTSSKTKRTYWSRRALQRLAVLDKCTTLLRDFYLMQTGKQSADCKLPSQLPHVWHLTHIRFYIYWFSSQLCMINGQTRENPRVLKLQTLVKSTLVDSLERYGKYCEQNCRWGFNSRHITKKIHHLIDLG